MRSIQRRALTLVAAGAFVSGGLLAVPGPLAAQAAGNQGRWTRSGPPPRVEAAGTPAQGADKGPSSASHFAQLHAQKQLVANQAEYDQAKASDNAEAPAGVPEAGAPQGPSSGPLAPVASRNFSGVFDTDFSPPDTTGAVGTMRFMELVNAEFAIYGRTSNTPIATGPLASL